MAIPIIVTGGAGYIGSHICKALAAAGFLPVTLDNLTRGHASLVRFGPLEQMDIRDAARVEALLRHYQPSLVVHCAGYIAVGESVRDPMLYYQQNIVGTLSLLQAMGSAGVEQLIFSSSCAVHGMPETQPIQESTPYAPISPYGATKMMAEMVLRDCAAATGLRYLIFRYFNACGADASAEIGECHEPETHLIPLAIRAAMGALPLQVFGNDYPTPDGTAIRDYVHVADIARAHISGVNYLLQGGDSDILNIGSGRGYSVQEVIAETERVVGCKLPSVAAPRRLGDVPLLLADIQKIRHALGFEPVDSTLDRMIASAYQWEQKRRISHD